MINKLRVIEFDELNAMTDDLLLGYQSGLAMNWGSLPAYDQYKYLPMVENIKKIIARRAWLKARDAFIARLRNPETDDEALLVLLAMKALYLDEVPVFVFEHLGQLEQLVIRVDVPNIEEQRDLIRAEIKRRASCKQ